MKVERGSKKRDRRSRDAVWERLGRIRMGEGDRGDAKKLTL